MKKLPLLILLFFCFQTFADKLPSISEKTASFKKYEGFMNYWWDEDNGKVWLEVSNLNQEFLYITSLPAGLGSNDIGLDRGLLGDEKVVFFNKVGRKILLIQPNLKYRAITNDSNEKRAVTQSFAQSTLAGFTIEAEENGKYLVEITDLLMQDAMGVTDRIKGMGEGSYALDKSRSAMYFERTKNFPLNSEFEVSLTFTGGSDAGRFVKSVTPSAEAITLRMHHSFVQLPDNQYEKREFDPRSSFNAISYFDYSTPVSEPVEKYYTVRHRLKKKDPNAKVSEAVKPIIYYLDNGTPEPIRSALMEGTAWWNQAFEAAGYKNAFQVKLLPDDADPMDVRYNVINWVHRSTRGWSYGASVIDPRTGEILKGHVTLGSLRVRQDYLIAQGLLSPFENGKKLDPEKDPMLKMALARLRQLAAHEVGHTLGIMHNYSASTNNRASVMDYPHPRVSLNAKGEVDLSDAYAVGIGEWDKTSIAFGYQDFPKGTDEKAGLNKILQDARNKGLLFLTDQDARPAGSASPNAHLWDEGKDPVENLNVLLKVREKALANFGEKTIREGVPMAFLEDALVPIYNLHRYQIEAVSKIVGSVDYRYAVRGDGQIPTILVSKETQQRALKAAIQCLSPDVLTLPENIIKSIPPRPAGYNASRELFKKRTGLAFDALSAAESAADFPLQFLLQPERASRMVEYAARGEGITLDELNTQLIENTWKLPRKTGLALEVQLQTEQILLTHLLALSVNEKASYQVKALMGKSLKDLKAYIEETKKSVKDVSYQAHLDYALERMKNPSAAKVTAHKELPPGAPIGCEDEF
ncbi:zinc-dependent metalloprotease [Arcicella lustrica]|uniref:Zinc-dependent metalloprotease n=1 Tax=Arcicella lustrica TaxID=2984196 RepID=A0ABU5SPK5_9BACT|nr:zinc-dependent metalloprotease [Arcicella sp. DC25W]MEA5429092.1 zinc-dependent metalloprotease [Arcicella sp. DC25W]